MKMSSTTLLLAAFSMLLSACGESQSETSESLSSLAEREGMVTVDQSTIDSIRTADSIAVARGEVLKNASRKAMWLGSILAPRNGNTVVAGIVETVDGVDLRKGDVIEAVGGTAVATPQEVKEQYGQVEVGEPVRLTMRRAGTRQAVTFARPDPSEVPNLRAVTIGQ